MKINEIDQDIFIWRSNEEQSVLCKITEPTMLESFEEHDVVIIEQLIRKNLLIRVRGNYATYVYPA